MRTNAHGYNSYYVSVCELGFYTIRHVASSRRLWLGSDVQLFSGDDDTAHPKPLVTASIAVPDRRNFERTNTRMRVLPRLKSIGSD